MSDPYLVETYEPLSLMPAPTGLRAIFTDEPMLLVPVVAMAACRVRSDWYRDGRRVRCESVTREVCGVTAERDSGFSICEGVSNFVGYLAAGEEL